MIRYILFDLDGTLTDPAVGIIRSIQYACARLGAPVPAHDELLFAIGPPLQSTFSLLLDTTDGQAVRAAVDLYRERYASTGMLFENTVYPAADQMLQCLHAAGKKLYIATSKPTIYAARILRHFGLEGQFAGIHGSEMDGARSDKAELIAHILNREHLAPEETAMVGDRKHDILGARRNGIRAVGVTYGYGSEAELKAAGADALCATTEEIAALFNA